MSTYCYVDTYFPHFYKLTDVNTATTGRLRKNGQVPGYMKDRAKELDTIFAPPPTVQPKETLFVDIQGKLWKAACSYAHGGSLAINRELAGHDEQSLYEVLRTSTNLFVLLMNGMYELHHNHKKNDVLRGLADSFFAEKW
ncbi:MAG: hypothetical protein WA872_04545 [Candidatus Sulfotelmatobacter sp.]